MTTTIHCTQCSQTFPGDETEIDEEQILIPERYSTLIRRGLSIQLMIRNQEYRGPSERRDEFNTFTWESLLANRSAHATKHKLPSVAGDCVTFVNRDHNDEETGDDVVLGRASLSYVRAIEQLRREGEFAAFSAGRILYLPHGDDRRAKILQLIEAEPQPDA